MKSFIVAGGANGIGAAIAKELAASYDTYVVDADEPKAPIDTVSYFQADLTQADQAKTTASQLPSEIAGLVLSIGVMRRGTIFDSSEQDYDLLMDTNVKSAWLFPHLKKFSKDKRKSVAGRAKKYTKELS